MNELTSLTRHLAEHQVGFVIAGGLGVLLQGSSLMTRDVDIVCRMEPDNLGKLFAALEPLHPVTA